MCLLFVSRFTFKRENSKQKILEMKKMGRKKKKSRKLEPKQATKNRGIGRKKNRTINEN
jgi:hypothetical protein